MKIAIVHLSDIHFASSDDAVFNRFDKISAAAKSISSDVSAYFIAVSGDIANYGLASEYEIAQQFFNNIIKGINLNEDKVVPVYIAVCPGNHDCNFSDADQTEIRQAVLDKIPSKLCTLTPNSGLIKQCLSVQNDFFTFADNLPNTLNIPEDKKTNYEYDFEVEGRFFRFRIYNTAWISEIREKQGQLYFPTQFIEQNRENEAESPDLIISMFHHPYNWLNETNARTFKQVIESSSDIILTGHEHVEESFLKKNLTGENVRYIAGGVLQERGYKASKFNLIVIDTTKQLYKLHHFLWDNNSYKTGLATDGWVPFQRNQLLISTKFSNNSEFSQRLYGTGAVFIHPFRTNLTLKDLYVYPNLKKIVSNRKKSETIRGSEIVSKLLKDRYSIIYGDEYSGKTALLKTLYAEFQGKELVPILIAPDHELKGVDEDALKKCLDKAIKEQYDEQLKEPFHQLAKIRKVLIIDDFHKFQLNQDSQGALLEAAQNLFETIVITADRFYQLHTLVTHDKTNKVLLSFSNLRILEHGRKLRGDIIRKWLKLGREVNPSDDLSRQEIELEKVINDILGKNMVPSYPFFIVSIIQTWKSASPSGGNYGAFGYIYEELITNQLRAVGYDATQIDTSYTFLGRIAYYLFKSDQESFTIEELAGVGDDYFSDYDARIDVNDALKKLIGARILWNSNGNYRFNQPYIFYFFTARYIKENLAGSKNVSQLQKDVFDMINFISYEPYSYILLILVYLTKDKKFIDTIIKNSRRIYSESPLCDLSKSIDFLNHFQSSVEVLSLPSPDVEGNRDQYREKMDSDDIDDSENEERSLMLTPNQKIAYYEDMDGLSKLTIALRNLELMGQILRNFPGSLFGETKLGLAQECYSLGLRVLGALLSLAEESFDDFREYYTGVIKEKRVGLPDSEIKLQADALLYDLTAGATFGMIKRISQAVGHESLQETYKKVKTNLTGLNSVELIDLSIKLDHFKGIPHGAIDGLAKKFKNNNFLYNILRDLVQHFFYLYPVDRIEKQRLASKLEISIDDPQMILNSTKTLKKRSSRKKNKPK